MEHTFDTVDYKAAEAEFFLRSMATAGTDHFAFQCHLSAFLAASRTTTLALQQFKEIPGFEPWYQIHRGRLEKDSLAKYLHRLRNDHLHGGPYPIRGGAFAQGKTEYFFDSDPRSRRLGLNDIVSSCRKHFVTLLEIVFDCYVVLGPEVDPQQYFTKEHFAAIGRDIIQAEVEIWGFERSSLVEDGFDEDARWHELRTHVSGCKINHLFYSYLGKTTPEPKEPEEYADFAFSPEDRGWLHVPAGFGSLEEYWRANPGRRPADSQA